jgi:cell division septum initiation protein DivIVA
MEEVKFEEELLKEDRQKFLQKTKRLKEERDYLQQQVNSISQSQQVIQQLYSQGLVDENGDAINPPH